MELIVDLMDTTYIHTPPEEVEMAMCDIAQKTRKNGGEMGEI